MSEQDIISAEAIGMQVGDVVRMTCPWCNAAHEDSLRVTCYPERIAYNCFRVKCGKRGIIGGRYAGLDVKRTFKPKVCTEDMQYPPEQLLSWLLKKYEITEEEATLNGFKYMPKSHRIYMPTTDAVGKVWGGVAKVIKRDTGKPKTVLYQTREALRVHIPTHLLGRNNGAVIICEDILSAVKLTNYGRPISLLGTYMSDEMAVGIAKMARGFPVKIFLDYDAIDKAVKMRRKYGALCQWEIIINEQDPKDTPHEELERLL